MLRTKEVKSNDLKELKELMNAAMYEDINKLNRVDVTITLNEWFESWLKNYKNKTICANTRRHYITIYEKHISPALGKKKLSAITQINILELLNILDGKGYQFETRNRRAFLNIRRVRFMTISLR